MCYGHLKLVATYKFISVERAKLLLGLLQRTGLAESQVDLLIVILP